MDSLPIDLVGVIEKGVRDGQRGPDGLLHASGDLVGSLRHSQLGFVGAPRKERHLVENIRLRTGTMWHEYISSLLVAAGIPFQQEVALAPWMPEGWSGTADLIFYHPEYEAWVLIDIKTMKGEGLQWVERDGMKEEHLWQASAYWHALVAGGFPMLDKFGILYLPMSMVYGEEMPNPAIIEATPVSEDEIIPLMEGRYRECARYAAIFHEDGGDYLNDALAPEQDRVQKLFYGGKAKPGQWDVKLVPHWSAQFCEFPDELCACNTRKPEKIGHWTAEGGAGKYAVVYVPRKGYDIEPEVVPTNAEIRRRLK